MKNYILVFILSVLYHCLCFGSNGALANDEQYEPSVECRVEFKSVADKFVFQDLTESSLVNLFELIAKRSDDKLYCKEFGSESIKTLKNEKAFLMSLLRLNNKNQTYPRIDPKEISYLDVFSQGKEGHKLGLSVNRTVKALSVIDFIPFVLNGQKWDYPSEVWAGFSGWQYSEEVFSTLDGFVGSSKKSADTQEYPSDFDSFQKYIVSWNKNVSEKELQNRYDFIKYMDSNNISIYANGMPIQKCRRNAFCMGLVRLRLGVSPLGIFPEKYDQDFSSSVSKKYFDGRIYELTVDFPDGDKYLFFIKEWKENIVGIKRLSLANDGIIQSAMPESGAYYSPEFYRIIISLFADIARQELLESNLN